MMVDADMKEIAGIGSEEFIAKQEVAATNSNEELIAFYISDHGFGHASRNIPIIRYILEANKDIRIIIKTGKLQGEFIKDCT